MNASGKIYAVCVYENRIRIMNISNRTKDISFCPIIIFIDEIYVSNLKMRVSLLASVIGGNPVLD